ncbi:VCBS repeat-containing protein [Streptomyces sp. NBC_00322]|uniref:FG-GAP repeat domain-containing protein n=1 Tax=Streptomyces sp. NBC_00322 TaxID=2975712 RepID=UPI002E27CFFA|nr:VCBS repeat-containing protein [Streptomyces sp. NBC_00322]
MTIGTVLPASAQDSYRFEIRDVVLQPGVVWKATPLATQGQADGTMVYAFATKPLTGPAGDGAGLPEGLTFDAPADSGCKPAAGATAVYLCRIVGSGLYSGPAVNIAADTPDQTTGYYGAVYAPVGADLTEAVHAAQTAAATPADSTHGAATFAIKTAEHVAQNTLTFDSPDIAAGTATPQTLHVHAVDAGQLQLYFRQSPGQISWGGHDVDIRVTSVTSGDTAQCTHRDESLSEGIVLITCNLTPGDSDITYTLTTAPGTESWNITALSRYRVYSYGSDYRTAQSNFAVQGVPVRERYRLLGRDTSGRLFQYLGTGNAATPFQTRSLIGSGWQTYNALTKLSPLALEKSQGDLVARDHNGVLWHYRGVPGGPFASRVRVGAGWKIYPLLTGAGDLTTDGKPDLLARDTSGVLWLYRGTTSPTAPLAPRTRIGSGWNTYSILTGTGDFTGDTKPDLLARDKAGQLWLYRGTGSPTAPFAPRTRIGSGWNTYSQLAATGDLTADGRPDIVARDTSGVLWLYRGTTSPTAPLAPRTKIGSGWNTYNHLI